ncbi:Facilitated trehalose transporter Tret1, partial [Diplonema papillatum]
WRSLAIVCLSVNCLSFVSVLFLPESPVWLISKGRREDAHAALTKLRSADSNVEEAISMLEMSANQNVEESAGWSGLLIAPRSKALGIGIGLMVVQQLCGVNAVMFYASYILGIVWPDPATANKYAVGSQALQMVVTISAGQFMDKLGRKKMLTIAGTGLLICCALMNIYFFDDSMSSTFVVIGFYGYVAAFAMGMGAIPWFIMGELFHPEVKGIASSIATFVNWMLSFMVTKTVQNMQTGFGGGNAGMGWVFTCYGAVCFLGLFYINLCVPETKGMSYEQLEQILLGKHKPQKASVSSLDG